MLSQTVNAPEILHTVDLRSGELLHLTEAESEKVINTVPFTNSWTAAQLMDHVTKSTQSIAQAMNQKSNNLREPSAKKIQELSDMFLDYEKKFNAPEFILPGKDFYEKNALIVEYKSAFNSLQKGAQTANLSEAVSHRVFGDITKNELLHFVAVHTERHIHQLKKIIAALKEDTASDNS